ncbi:MAG: BatA and WFA domain-containing protein [Phycisphaerae bacterium]
MPDLPTFLAPVWAWMGLLALPLIALYILRQKRPDLTISSTLLWAKALQDTRASRPWQRLRNNILLLLQLLILAAVVLAMMRPVMLAQARRGTASVIILDTSASMQATDSPEGSRLTQAITQAKGLIDALRPGDQMMLIAEGGGMQTVRTTFSQSKADLHKALARVVPLDTSSDLAETLLLAATSLKAIGADPSGAAPGQIYLLSDGAGLRLPNVPNIDKVLQFIRIGQSSANVGIIRVAATPLGQTGNQWQIFVGLVNNTDTERKVTVGVAPADKTTIIATQIVALPAYGQGSAVLPLVALPGRMLIQVDSGGPDDFRLDNTAYVYLTARRQIKVELVSTGNPLLERFLQAAARNGLMDSYQVIPSAYDPQAKADLVIFDGVAPAALPPGDALFIRPTGPTAGFKFTGMLDKPPVLRWKREDPVLAYLELAELRILRAAALAEDPDTEVLISAPTGPLFVRRTSGPRLDYLLTFDPLTESNWWRQPSFLVWLQNIVEATRVRKFIGMPQLLTTGQTARLFDVPEKSEMTMPDGQHIPLQITAGGAEFATTDKVGFYRLEAGEKSSELAVNLLSTVESDIQPHNLSLPTGQVVAGSESIAKVNQEIWPWFAAAALALLVLEWIAFHRQWGQ